MKAISLNDWDSLEEKYFGKSSAKYDASSVPVYEYANLTSNAYAPDTIPMELPARRSPQSDIAKKRAEAQNVYRQKILDEYKIKERYVSRKRFKEALAVSLAIAVAAGMFAFVLYRQSQITTLNFHNNALQSQILKTEQETRQIEEQVITNADLDQIRWDAMESLGMQEPGVKQIVVLEIPQSDHLVTSTSNTTSSGTKASIAEAKMNLAAYFSTLE